MKAKKERSWETVSCRNCDSNKTTVLFDQVTSWEHEGIFTIVSCVRCDLSFVNPRPVPSHIGKYYPPESYWGESMLVENTKEDWMKERKESYGFLYNIIFSQKKKGKIFDIGAGKGLFLSRFKERGWETDGVELSKDASKFAKKAYGITIRTGDFLQLAIPKNTLSVVTLNNVLEHLYEPKETLAKIHTCLEKDGFVLITVPNIESIGAKLFQKNWYPLQPPRHLYHFSIDTLTDMLSRSGFEVKGIYHGYRIHNYFSLFESFRLQLSPRFKKRTSGGKPRTTATYPSQKTVKKQLGKVIARLASLIISSVEPFIGRGEVITIYATKKS